MALSDYKFTILVLGLVLIYFQFFNHDHHDDNSQFSISSQKIVFHSNWTKSLDDICCLGKLHDALTLQGIQSLDVSLSMSSSFNDDDLKKIFHVTKFQAYQNIKIDLSGLNITNSGIEYVLNLVQSNIKNLQIHLNGITTKTGFGVFLAQKLNVFTQLTSLKVSLIMSIKASEVDGFIGTHKLGKQLKSLDLILIGNEITKDGLAHLQEYITGTQLNDLHLNLYANKLGAQGAQVVANALRNENQLESLHLDFYFNNITQVGTQNITQVVGNFANLKQLELNFDFNYIKNQGGKAIGKMLQKLTTLQSLHIGVASKNFGYLGFKYVVAGLQKLTQLKKLIFRSGINRVGINGAQITKQMLTKMTQLEHLEIGFVENYVGDDGIGLIAEQVASMKTLKSVYLNLAFNDAKSYGLIKTVKSFLNNNYTTLHLNLGHNEFKDNEVKLIESHLSTLIGRNEEFIFDFTDTAISKNEVKSLQKVFADANKKFNKNARLSVNSIIVQEEPVVPQKVAKTSSSQSSKNQSKQL